MNSYSLISYLLCVMILSSCGVLLSPVGEELIIDGAEEVIKIEKELVASPTSIIPIKELSPEVK